MSAAASERSPQLTLWSRQHRRVLETLQQSGVYHVKKAFIIKKYADVADIMLHAYHWYVHQAQQIVPRPEGAEFPVWLSTDPLYETPFEDSVLLKVEVQQDLAILFERAKWNRILNLAYLPQDDRDLHAHQHTLERSGIQNETDLFLTPFYPRLKQKVKTSWQRLFLPSEEPRHAYQATLWELRQEWVRVVETL